MESLDAFFARIGTMNRVRSAGFWACGFGRLSSRPVLVHRTRKSGKPAGWKACATSRFMGSPHSFFRTHWDHEPTPNPSQEGDRQDADELLLPSWEGSGVGRFMGRACVHHKTPVSTMAMRA